MTLNTPTSAKVNQLYSLSKSQRIGTALLAIGMLGYTLFLGYNLWQIYSKSQELQEKKTAQIRALVNLKEQAKTEHLEPEKIDDFISGYTQLEKQRLLPLGFIEILNSLKNAIPAKIISVKWSADDAKSNSAIAPGSLPSGDKITASVKLELQEAAKNPEFYKILTAKLLQSFKLAFTGYDVKYSNELKPLASESSEITLGNEPEKNVSTNQALQVEMQVTRLAGAAAPRPATPAPSTEAQ